MPPISNEELNEMFRVRDQKLNDIDKQVGILGATMEKFESRVEKTLYDINVKLESVASLPSLIAQSTANFEARWESRMHELIKLHGAECAASKPPAVPPMLSPSTVEWVVRALILIVGALVGAKAM